MHEELMAAALRAAKAGGAVLRRYYGDATLEVASKGRNDFVTRADRESETAVVGELRQAFPDHRVLAEEGGAHPGGSSELEWVIDPLDGTTNFLQGLPVWAVSIACRREEELVAAVVLDPCSRNVFTAARGEGAFWNDRPMRVSERSSLDGAFLATGYPFRAKAALDVYLEMFRAIFQEARAIRRCGAAALDLAYTAAGVYDGFFEFRLSPWDVAAGALLIEESGGAISDLDGGRGWFTAGNILAGSPGVHRDLLTTARAHASEERIDQLVP